MPYQNNIPQATDQLSNSQLDIQNNFAAIKTLVDVNHVTFDTTDQGKHKWVSFPVQGSAPTTTATEVALYSQTSSLSGVPELVFRRDTNGTSYEFTSAGMSNNGWTRLPSGILLKWGNTSGTGLTTVTFPTGATIPAFTNIFSIQVTTAYVNSSDGDGFVRLNQFITPWTTFTVFCSPRTTTGSKLVAFQYLAIGI